MTEEPKGISFCEMVLHIVKRPAMYGVSNVEDINLFIFGYQIGRGSEILNAFLGDFRDFVNEEFADDFSSKKDYDWPRLIRFGSASDSHSIELFGRRFEMFIDLNKEKYRSLR